MLLGAQKGPTIKGSHRRERRDQGEREVITETEFGWGAKDGNYFLEEEKQRVNIALLTSICGVCVA